jgi:hypothetical protein
MGVINTADYSFKCASFQCKYYVTLTSMKYFFVQAPAVSDG